MRAWIWTTVLSILSIVAAVQLFVRMAPPSAMLYTAGAFLLFLIPGIFIGRMLFGTARQAWPERAIFGAVLGIAISSYVAIAVGFLHGWSPRLISLAILGLAFLCAILGRVFRDRPLLPMPRKWAPAEYTILAGMGLALVLFCALPYLNVGKLTSNGYGYTWLFGLDLLGRADYISAMMVKLPPDNLWMTGTPLRMYLVGYAVPAFAYSASGEASPLHALVLFSTLGLSLLLLASLYAFLRTFFSSIKILSSLAFLALFSYSYYWFYDFAKWIVLRPGERAGFLSDPYFWNYEGVSHLFQRMFLVEPQAALATALFLVVLTALSRIRYELSSLPLGILIGMCLGICFGIDAMQGLVVTVWFGLVYVARLGLAKGKLREEYAPFLGAVVSCGLVCGSFFLLGMYKSSTSHLVEFHLYLWIFLFGIFFFPVEFGPLILLGLWGVVAWWRQHRTEFGWPLLLLAGVALAEVAFVRLYATPPRMADRLLPIVLLVFSGYLFRGLWSAKGGRVARFLVIAIVVIGVPTFFTDVYFASNVEDIYHTRYVRVEDRIACDWIRQTLPETAVIQGEPQYFAGGDHGRYMSLFASFAGRPQVAGWYSGAAVLVDNGWAIGAERRADIQKMLSSAELPPLLKIVQKYSIEYLYVGPFEQEGHKQLLPLLQSAPDRFREVYAANGVHIFRYFGNGADSASLSPPDRQSRLNSETR